MSEINSSCKIAFIFPGQGSQYVGMGKDWHDNSPKAKEMFGRASEILGFDIAAICFRGPEDKLRQTEVTQPAIFLHSAIAFSLLDEKNFGAAAGHSLGEYSALFAAGALEFEHALMLVGLRGRLMQHAGEVRRGTMAAVVGLEDNLVEEICREASKDGIVQPANYNSSGQIVISGDVEAVHGAMELAKVRGAKIVKELVVSGAFHSSLMEAAKEELKKAIDATPFHDANVPVYANVSGKPLKDADEIKDALVRQLTSPVRWQESVVKMFNDGIAKFVEIGPGKVLQGLVKRTVPAKEIFGIDKMSEADLVVRSVTENR
ncbi:MAG TPA: ACP S-malonyltransferase [Candidatus Acidoferrales bacterium]|nr:ACP S-malonyltransferase [Candidatus Acidoferrales bacterium]